MSSFLKCSSLAALAGVVLLAASATKAHAQPGQMTVGQAMGGGQLGPNLGAGRIMSLPATAGVGALGAYGGGYNPYFPGDYNAWAGGTHRGSQSRGRPRPAHGQPAAGVLATGASAGSQDGQPPPDL